MRHSRPAYSLGDLWDGTLSSWIWWLLGEQAPPTTLVEFPSLKGRADSKISVSTSVLRLVEFSHFQAASAVSG